jgi:hypothetical protein
MRPRSCEHNTQLSRAPCSVADLSKRSHVFPAAVALPLMFAKVSNGIIIVWHAHMKLL